jgi:hypothetical protein
MKIKERRAKPRIDCDYPAVVHLLDRKGNLVEEQGILRNLSAGGMYLSLPRRIAKGRDLTVSFRFSSKPSPKTSSVSVTASGVVVRNNTQTNGMFGLAIKLVHYRFR